MNRRHTDINKMDEQTDKTIFKNAKFIKHIWYSI